MSGVSIEYGDFALGAKESFVPQSESDKYNTASQLQYHNLNFPNYGNPLEKYSVLLDGRTVPFSAHPDTANIGLISKELSGADGTFTPAIVMELTSTERYSSQGLTFTFDTYNNIFCNSLNVKWYRNSELLFSEDFIPSSAVYFCRKQVENYDKVVITFNSLNMPENRLKLRVIDYGYGTVFYGDELRNVKCLQEINPISSEISINTVDFTLDSKRDINYSFSDKQPISVYYNGELRATTFVKSAKRKSRTIWEVQSEDYIGLMDGIPYKGGMYTDVLATEILEDIFSTAKVPYESDSDFNEVRLTGYIPYTTCREALMQVAFGIQAVVDTSDSDKVKVKKLDTSVKQTIPLNRIMQDPNYVSEEAVTCVRVVAHKYTPVEDMVDVYSGEESGAGQNIFVKFDEPLHDLSISRGQILKSGVNYAVITANSNSVLTGKKYEHTSRINEINRLDGLTQEKENVVTIDKATLVSGSNADNVLNKCYEWLTRNNVSNLKIIEGKHISGGEPLTWGMYLWGDENWGGKTPIEVTYDQPISVGDTIKAETEYLGEVEGIVTSQKFNLNGNIIVKEAVLQ